MRDQKDFVFHVFKALCKIHFPARRQEISFKTTVNAYLFFRENILLHKLSTGLGKILHFGYFRSQFSCTSTH